MLLDGGGVLINSGWLILYSIAHCGPVLMMCLSVYPWFRIRLQFWAIWGIFVQKIKLACRQSMLELEKDDISSRRKKCYFVGFEVATTVSDCIMGKCLSMLLQCANQAAVRATRLCGECF